ncbi:beta-ketoacyl synthase N-terminal-like domain-containing protein [Kribbella sp. NPDC023972]|uniref:beta-ketoacyl synthase N-terminal-like domain-containing protein n=1 Tax=Kribbella sp. NPDC023972 TaxID=3154795 RepID=UPI003411D66C
MPEVHIDGWSAVHGAELGRDWLVAALRTSRTDPAAVPGPQPIGLDLRERLGRKGTRLYDEVVLMTSAVVGDLLGDHDSTAGSDAAALVIGTTNGSLNSLRNFCEGAFAKPPVMNPAAFPATIMNNAAGQVAIRYGLRGPNATVSAGVLSGATAVRYAGRLIRQRRAEVAWAGGVEEGATTATRGIAEDRDGARPWAAGCAMVRLSGRRSERTLATVTHVAQRRLPATTQSASPETALAECIDDCLLAGGISAGAIASVVLTGCGSATSIAAERAAAGRFADAITVDLGAVLGDTGSAGSAYTLAGQLASGNLLDDRAGAFSIGLAVGDRAVNTTLIQLTPEN